VLPPDKYYCECDDFRCTEIIDIPDEQYRKLNKMGRIIISSNCGRGVAPNKVSLIGTENGYTVYELVKTKE